MKNGLFKSKRPKQVKALLDNYRSAAIAVLVFFLPLVLSAQMPAKYQKINGKGFTWNGGQYLDDLTIPAHLPALAPNDTGRVAIFNGELYISYKNGSIASWKLAALPAAYLPPSPDTGARRPIYVENGEGSKYIDTTAQSPNDSTLRLRAYGTDFHRDSGYVESGPDSTKWLVKKYVDDRLTASFQSNIVMRGNVLYSKYTDADSAAIVGPADADADLPGFMTSGVQNFEGAKGWYDTQQYFGGTEHWTGVVAMKNGTGWWFDSAAFVNSRPALVPTRTYFKWNSALSALELGNTTYGWRQLAYSDEIAGIVPDATATTRGLVNFDPSGQTFGGPKVFSDGVNFSSYTITAGTAQFSGQTLFLHATNAFNHVNGIRFNGAGTVANRPTLPTFNSYLRWNETDGRFEGGNATTGWKQLGYQSASGTATLVAGTVTVSVSSVSSTSKILVTVNTPGGTRGFLSVPAASIVTNTSFVINSTQATETSTVNWWIVD